LSTCLGGKKGKVCSSKATSTKTWRKRKAGMVHASEQVHDMLDAVLRMNVRRPGIISTERNFSFRTSNDSKNQPMSWC
jgi:hypothetical protein